MPAEECLAKHGKVHDTLPKKLIAYMREPGKLRGRVVLPDAPQMVAPTLRNAGPPLIAGTLPTVSARRRRKSADGLTLLTRRPRRKLKARPGATKDIILVPKRGPPPRRQPQGLWEQFSPPTRGSVRSCRALPPSRRPMPRGRSDLRRLVPSGLLIPRELLMHRRLYRSRKCQTGLS